MAVDISGLASSCRGAPSGDILTLPARLPLLLGLPVLSPPPAATSLRGGAENDTENPHDLPAHFAVCHAPPVPFGPLEKNQISPSNRHQNLDLKMPGEIRPHLRFKVALPSGQKQSGSRGGHKMGIGRREPSR